MIRPIYGVGLLLLIPALNAACSSDTTSDAEDGSVASTDGPITTRSDTSTPGTDGGTIKDAGPIHASDACVIFCSCMDTWCSDSGHTFPDGCLTDCANQHDWLLDCRQVMCNNVEAQPKNDHCTHAFGIGECLNDD